MQKLREMETGKMKKKIQLQVIDVSYFKCCVNGNVVICSDSGYLKNIFDISVANVSGAFVNLIHPAD